MIYVIGIGPGKLSAMTIEAEKALEKCDVIVGYKVYIDLLKNDFPAKEFASTPMGKEIERCKLCFEYSRQGKTVAMVCSGDAGVYGMAEPIFRLQKENSVYQKEEIELIPGVTAALSGAALLGAPLNHDFCVISLSDLLTPWEMIERRLKAAVQGDCNGNLQSFQPPAQGLSSKSLQNYAGSGSIARTSLRICKKYRQGRNRSAFLQPGRAAELPG